MALTILIDQMINAMDKGEQIGGLIGLFLTCPPVCVCVCVKSTPIS